MSTDSTQPMSPPAPQAGEPPADQPAADAPAAAVPTVQSPTIQAPPPPPPPSKPKAMAAPRPEPEPEPEPAKPSPEPGPAAQVPAPPTVIQPAQPQPAQPQPDHAEPTVIQPVQRQPQPQQVHAAPTVIQPAQAPLPQVQPVHSEPTVIQPAQAPLPQVQPVHAEPTVIQPPQAPPAPAPSPWTEPQPWVDTPRDDVPPLPPPPPPGGYPLDRQPRQQPPAYGPPRARRRRRRPVRRSVMALFAVIVLALLLTIADRVGLAVAENEMATQMQQQGFPIKPSVTVDGVPFLNQYAAKDFKRVDVSASNVQVQLPSGGSLTISTIHATARGLHFSSYTGSGSARADTISGTAFISFSSLSSAAGIAPGDGVTFAPVDSDTVRVTATLDGILSDSEDVRFIVAGPQAVSVRVLPGSGTLGAVLSSFGSFTFNLPPGLPSAFKITGLTAGAQGLTLSGGGANATFDGK